MRVSSSLLSLVLAAATAAGLATGCQPSMLAARGSFVVPARVVAGAGVDPATSRFSGARSAN